MKKIDLPILIPIVVLLALLLPVTGNASPARANVVLTVDTVLDNAALTTCSSTIANDCSLRGAIIKVNTNPNTSYQINIPSGTYNLTIQGSGENNTQTGDLDIRRSVTIVGASANDPTLTKISAGLISDRVIHILSPSNGAQINVTSET